MRTRATRSSAGAISLIEVLVVLVLSLVLAAVLLPMLARTHSRSGRISCVENLKNIGGAFRIWAGDSNTGFPMNNSTNKGGSAEVSSEAWRTFQLLTNRITAPKTLVCPSDMREPVRFWTSLSNPNLSYFICLDAAVTTPEVFLTGDRNLTNGWPTTNHVLTVTPNTPVGWTHEMHQFQGNVALSDGSVQQTTSLRLQQRASVALRSRPSTNAILRLAMPE